MRSAESHTNRSLFAMAFFVAILTMAAPHANAAVINWVDMSPYPPGAPAAAGLVSVDGLALTATWSNLTDFALGNPVALPFTLDDPSWPFSNDDGSMLTVRGDQALGGIDTQLRFDFTSAGGLPVGGSLAVIDLEDADSAVTITGIVGGSAVPVNWLLGAFQTTGVDVAPPIWDPGTSTLTGSGEKAPDTNNFIFFVTNVALDAVTFDILGAPDDGIGFAASRQTAVIPEPTSISLLALGGLALLRRRRK